MDIYKGILRSSTDLLRTYNREELNQFLGRYLIEGLHLSHLSLKRIFGWWKFLGDCSCLLLCKIVTLRLFGGRCLVAKALPCKGVKVHKLEVAFISKFL